LPQDVMRGVYWIARSSRATTSSMKVTSHPRPRFVPEFV